VQLQRSVHHGGVQHTVDRGQLSQRVRLLAVLCLRVSYFSKSAGDESEVSTTALQFGHDNLLLIEE